MWIRTSGSAAQDFDPAAGQTTIAVFNTTNHDIANKSVTIDNVPTSSLLVKDHGTICGLIVNGIITNPDSGHVLALNGNQLVVTWSTLGQQLLTLEIPPASMPVAISISGPTTLVEAGTGAYTCTLTYRDGNTVDATSTAEWSVARGPGSFSSPGAYAAPASVTGDVPVSLRVSYTENAITVQATLTVTITNVREPVALAINGPQTVNDGRTANYTCTVTYDDGTTEDVTSRVTWSVSNGPGAFASQARYAAPSSVLTDTPVSIRAILSQEGVTQQADTTIIVTRHRRHWADLNRDAHVDVSDLTLFQACESGPSLLYDLQNLSPECTVQSEAGRIDPDFDGDGDVDSTDFAIFQQCLTGSDIPISPDCSGQ